MEEVKGSNPFRSTKLFANTQRQPRQEASAGSGAKFLPGGVANLSQELCDA